jgi:hypothetical protein
MLVSNLEIFLICPTIPAIRTLQKIKIETEKED